MAERVNSPALTLPVGKQLEGLIFDLDGTLYLNRPLRRAMMLKIVRSGLTRPLATWHETRIVYHFRRAQEHLRADAHSSADQQLGLAAKWSGRPIDQ